MPPPLPQREGLDPVRYRIPNPAATPPGRGAHGPEPTPAPRGSHVPGTTALAGLRQRYPALADPAATPLEQRFARGDIVRADGTAWAAEDVLQPGDELWFHRELRQEHVPDVDLVILHQDEHLLVADKPHDMATMPRGSHVLSSALVRLRRSTGITTLSPLHRLDRRTAGVLAFGVDPAERSAYQELFARREVRKEYLAWVAPYREGAAVPADLPTMVGARTVVRDRLVKEHGDLLARMVAGEPNAITEVEVAAVELDGTLTLRLRPLTGRTHQLRAQLASRGMPIVGEDLYPTPRDPVGPLHLLARSLAFTDPVTGQERRFTSALDLPGPPHERRHRR
ncbi:pseudouridine synthase [Brachybacterium sp. p3-SID1565]|uniref:RNA pseudouridylate synthase n=1 Tax=Brachybacterium epidermidis TaxID=2781983 RepID=A0ABR9W039_9MICO|nr:MULTISPECIES: pseudouridine synthase [Brachybacterium]MBE9403808.1 23S rRNA pseudouridylate synthase [Brachybacterium epidermidis]MCT1384075.1 pseudouridine synthase [Brachybacterium sp. p3-SID1565]